MRNNCRGVTSHSARSKSPTEARSSNAGRDVHGTTEFRQVSAERSGDGLGATAGNGPSHSVGGRGKDDGECRSQGLIQRQHGMRGQSGEDCLGSGGCETSGVPVRLPKGSPATPARSRKGCRGNNETGLRISGAKFVPVLGEWRRTCRRHRLPVFAESSFGGIQVALQNHRRAVVQRMRHRRRRLNPLQAVSAAAAKRRTAKPRHGMHGRTEIMLESRQRERQGARAAAGLRLGLETSTSIPPAPAQSPPPAHWDLRQLPPLVVRSQA